MRILVTGDSGKIGRSVVSDLGREHEVVGLSRHPASNTGLSNYSPYELDIRDSDGLRELFKTRQFDAIVHLAALVGAECESRGDDADATNVKATAELGMLAVEHGVKRFVNISTSAVYKQTAPSPTSESDNIEPFNVYGKTKLTAENTLDMIAKDSTVTDIISLRVFNVYGRRFNGSLVNGLMNSDQEHPAKLYSWQRFGRDYIHVRDVSKAIRLAITSTQVPKTEHTAINIGSGVMLTNEELVKGLVAKGWDPQYVIPRELDEATYTWADTSLAEELLDFSPAKGLIIPRTRAA